MKLQEGWQNRFACLGRLVKQRKEIDVISGATISASVQNSDIVAAHEIVEYFLTKKNLVVVD